MVSGLVRKLQYIRISRDMLTDCELLPLPTKDQQRFSLSGYHAALSFSRRGASAALVISSTGLYVYWHPVTLQGAGRDPWEEKLNRTPKSCQSTVRNLSPQKHRATVHLLLGGHHGKLTAPRAQPGTALCRRCQPVSPYLFHHHSELALCAQNRLHTREPLHAGENFRRPDEDLPRIKAVRIIKEETLWGKRKGKNQHKRLSLLNLQISAFLFSFVILLNHKGKVCKLPIS